MHNVNVCLLADQSLCICISSATVFKIFIGCCGQQRDCVQCMSPNPYKHGLLTPHIHSQQPPGSGGCRPSHCCAMWPTHSHTHTHTHTHTHHSNHQVVEGSDHQTVVQLIRNSGSQVHLVVVSVTADESRKLEPENTGMSAMDYFERRSVPVSIPDTEKMRDDAGKEYVVYNIYLANKHTTSRRYREFDALNNNVSYD